MVDEIPIIDIEPFRFGNASARRRVAADVSQACEGVGFLTVTGHGVPSAIVEEAFAQGFAFFDQPDDEKWAAAPPDGQILRGYSGMAKQSLDRKSVV